MSTTPTPTANPQYLPPDFSEFISRRMRDVAANLNCCLIGQVVSFNPANQTIAASVNFQKILKGIVPIPGGIADQVIDYPNLINVPVFIYQGGGAYITMPIAKGDDCLIFFHDRDMDTWFQTGQVAPPNSDRVHNINDAIAFVGIRNILNALANYWTDGIYLNVPYATATNNFEVGNAATGVFSTGDGQTVTVMKGIIISIV